MMLHFCVLQLMTHYLISFGMFLNVFLMRFLR